MSATVRVTPNPVRDAVIDELVTRINAHDPDRIITARKAPLDTIVVDSDLGRFVLVVTEP